MASSLKNLSSYDEKNIPSAKEMSFGIVVSEWNKDITHKLYEGCLSTLLKHGAQEGNIHVLQVPGTFELPFGGRQLLGKNKVNAVICLGCVIQGETKHNEYINQSVANTLSIMSISTGIPFIFGILTPNNHQQAVDRSGGSYGNKGVEAAVAAIRLGALKKELIEDEPKIGFNL